MKLTATDIKRIAKSGEGSCSSFSIDKDLDKDFFTEFRTIVGYSAHIKNNQIMKNLKLFDEENNFKNGSVLFFGKEPEKFFDTAIIRCVAFEGLDKVQIIDDKVFGGTLMTQYRQTMQWLKQKLNIRYIIEGGGPRKEQWEIPESVFKESLINALSHRDYYDRGSKTIIELFDDRVEITNPGGLVSAIKPEEFGLKSHSRNPLIFGLFNRMNMVEQVGSGIGRILKDMENIGLPPPIYKTVGLFTVVFMRAGFAAEKIAIDINAKTRVKTRVKILAAISKNNKITRDELAVQLGITIKGIDWQIKKMKEEGILNRIGSDKGGYWELIDDNK